MRKNLPEDVAQGAQFVKLCTDGESCVLDVPQDALQRCLSHPRFNSAEVAPGAGGMLSGADKALAIKR